jgi:ATP-dependent DNA helicase
MILGQLGVTHTLVNALHVGGGHPFDATKRAVACLLLMSNRPMAEVEAILLQHTRDRAAAGNIRQVASRTRDVIDAVVQVGMFHGRAIAQSVDAGDIGIQLELGLPAELVPLAQRFGADLNRGEYLALLAAGITTVDQVLDQGVEGLGPVIARTTAERIVERARER